jgi:CRISPR-associated protein Csb1
MRQKLRPCGGILGLAITAFTYSGSGYLRQGCNLVLDADRGREFKAVYGEGRRVDLVLSHGEALAYAKAAAGEFGVGQSREVQFDRDRAKADLGGDGTKKAKGKAAKAK